MGHQIGRQGGKVPRNGNWEISCHFTSLPDLRELTIRSHKMDRLVRDGWTLEPTAQPSPLSHYAAYQEWEIITKFKNILISEPQI